MKYKVKFRLAAEDGKKQKYSVNMEDGAHLILGTDTLGAEFKDLVDHGPICVLNIKEGALFVKMHEKSAIKLNNKEGEEFAIRPGDFLQARKFVIEFLEVPYTAKATAMETRFVDINEIPNESASSAVSVTSPAPAPTPILEPLKPQEQTLMAAALTTPNKSVFEDLRPKMSEEKTFSGAEKTPTSVWEEVTAHYLVRPTMISYGSKRDLMVSYALGGFTSAIVFQILFKFLEVKGPWGVPGALFGFLGVPIAATMLAGLFHFSANFFGIAAQFGSFLRYFNVMPLVGLIWALSFAFPRSVSAFASFLYATVALGIFVFWFRPVKKVKFYSAMSTVGVFVFVGLYMFKPATQEGPHEVNVTEMLNQPPVQQEATSAEPPPVQAASAAPVQAQAPVPPPTQAQVPAQASAQAVGQSQQVVSASVPVQQQPTAPVAPVNMPVRSEVVAPAPAPVTRPATAQTLTSQTTSPAPVQAKPVQVEKVGELRGRMMAEVPEYDGTRNTKASTLNNRRSVSAVPDPLVNEEFFNAARTGNLKVVRELVNSKAVDPNFTLDRGTTALMYASANGHIQLVKYFVGMRVNVNAKDPYGTTALMWAAAKGHKQVVEYLLTKGADPSVRRDDGRNAEEIAKKWGKTQIVQLLAKYRQDASRSLAGSRKK